MPRISSPLHATSASGTTLLGAANSLVSGGVTDTLRQYMIFELVNVDHSDSVVPQGNPIFPYMVLHINPESLEEQYQKLITRTVTRGGFVEQHWGEELDSLSCTASTGAFVSTRTGVSVLNRKASIAYRKYLELVALYRNGGSVYDQRGNIVFHGGINLHFDSNIYSGYFENLTVGEKGDSPFVFSVDFAFKVKTSIRTVGL